MTTPDTAAIRAQMDALDGHTSGPWKVVIDDDGSRLSGRPSVIASDELDCAIVHWDGFVQEYWRSARSDKEIRNNARLIAAAPDMRETILALCDALDELRAEVLAGSSWPTA